MRIVIIPPESVGQFNAVISNNSAISTRPEGDYPHIIDASLLDEPTYRTFFQQRRTEGHNIWTFEQVDYSKWGSFSFALMTSAVGQRVMAGAPTNVYASFASALASSNATNINAVLPTVVAVYQLTAEEKTEFNNLVTKYGVELQAL